MSILGHSLGLRVTLLSVAITAAALIGTSLVAGDRARSMVLERGAEETRAVADQLVELCDLAQTAVQDKIESDLAFARMALQARAAGEPAWSERLRLDEQATETVGPFTVPRLLLDDASLTGDTGLVDSVREATGSTCTIFQLLPGRWVRVATNVKRPDGSRATGTTLDEGSPVYETVMAGRTYYGNNVIRGTRFYPA